MSIFPSTPTAIFSFYPEMDLEEALVVMSNTSNEKNVLESSNQFISTKESICSIVGYQAEKIASPYSMTQRQKSRVDSEIGIALFNTEKVSIGQIEDSREFITKAAKSPRLLTLTG